MTWQVFAGEHQELYEALLVQRCIEDGLNTDPSTVGRQLRIHLHRGIAYMAATGYIRNIGDLVSLAIDNAHPGTEAETGGSRAALS